MSPTMEVPPRLILLTLILELISTLLRQVFDFLGYMWLPILLNFTNILSVILGIFGVQEGRAGYLGLYLAWTPLWLAWNIFLICFYRDLGSLNADESQILSLGTGSFSWWLANGQGCVPEYTFNPGAPGRPPLRPSAVKGCALGYRDVETAQAGLQVLLGALGLILGASRLGKTRPGPSRAPNARSMFSIEYSPKSSSSGAPNTPRRTKRRSNNSSARGSHRRAAQNPVNRLLETFPPPVENDSNSRPNSLYGAMIGPPGPQSTMPHPPRCSSSLTSYSNFHQQRRPGGIPTSASGGGVLSQTELLQGGGPPLGEEEEGDELPLPPPPASLGGKGEDEGNYCDTQTLYAGEGAIPKRLPPYGAEAHGPGCACSSCQRKMTAI